MASLGRFKPNGAGYRAVMNGNELMGVCEAHAGRLAASASSQSGIDYRIDSRQGLNRIHTRVSTVTKVDYFRERSLRALAITAGQYGSAVGQKGHRSYHDQVTRIVKRSTGRLKKNSYPYKRY